MILPHCIRAPLNNVRRALCEATGNGKYSRPSLHELDRKLERYLDFDRGFFVEAGANDGFEQSNTYYFERIRRWTGVLIEPVPWLASKCRLRRPSSIVFEAALVPFGYPQEYISLDYSNLTSSVHGAFEDEEKRKKHQEHGLAVQPQVEAASIEVRARSLQSLLDEAHAPHDFDLLSLDVEGYEAMALAGLDFSIYSPRYLLIEVRDHAAIRAGLGGYYDEIEILASPGSYQDVLYARR